MEFVDYVLSGSLVLVFLAGTLVYRKSWFLIEAVMCAITGAATYIIPRNVLQYVVNFKDDDTSSIYRLQMVGSQLVFAAYVTYYLRKSTDKSVVQSLTVSKILICFTLLATMVIDRKANSNDFLPTHMTFGALGVALCFLGNLVQFVRAEFFGTGRWIMNDRLSKQMLLDFLISTCVMFPNLMWPETMIKSSTGTGFPVTSLGFYWCHVIGCFMLGTAIQLYAAIGFNDEDKRTCFIGRLISFTVYVSSVFYWTGLPNMLFGAGLFILLLNLICAIMFPPDNDKQD